MKPLIILENIRSAYNVGNIIRTADALWYRVLLSWFTPNPEEKEQVKKTSLWAEESVDLKVIRNTREALDRVKQLWYYLIAAECSENSSSLSDFDVLAIKKPIALLVGNENTWVLSETLQTVDLVSHIPMCWIKESLNVGQAAAIMMWKFRQVK